MTAPASTAPAAPAATPTTSDSKPAVVDPQVALNRRNLRAYSGHFLAIMEHLQTAAEVQSKDLSGVSLDLALAAAQQWLIT